MRDLKLRQCRLDDRYDILDCLGRGSYSEIYVASDDAAPDDSAHKLVVIKALNVFLQGPIDAELERTLIENFQNEAIALDRVRHPNIINRLGHGTAIDLSGTVFHYLVLEYLPGGDLFQVCRQDPLSFEQMLYYIEPVCAGLAWAHERGVIHRDIKPQNLLLTADRQTVKIADFGVAKIEASDGAITRVGTNIYAPPEHSPAVNSGPLSDGGAGSYQLTPAADIYSLAKTIYTLLVGESPRRFANSSIFELPASIADQFWSMRLLRVLSRATQSNPRDRYQTMQQFWEDVAFAAAPAQPVEAGPVKSSRPLSAPSESGVRELAENVPARPRFDSASELQAQAQTSTALPENTPRPRIVVAVDPPAQSTVNGNGRNHAAMPLAQVQDGPAATGPDRLAAPIFKPATRRNRFLVAGLLLLLFLGMLSATFAFFRSRSLWSSGATGGSTNDPDGAIGRSGMTLTDVNLRAGPAASNTIVGLAEQGAHVKVIGANGDWYQIEVVQHRTAKQDPESSDSGWMIKVYKGRPTIKLE